MTKRFEQTNRISTHNIGLILKKEKRVLYQEQVDSKGFWRWFITLGVTGVLDFVHRPVKARKQNVSETAPVYTFRGGGGGDTYRVRSLSCGESDMGSPLI
jgi:hypothetical protein